MELPDDDPATFERLVLWLYSKVLEFPNVVGQPSDQSV